MNLNSIIKPEYITLNLNAQDRDMAVRELAKLLERGGIVKSLDQFIEAVNDRENMTTTAVGFGIAIPHARSAAVVKPGVAIGRNKGFQWDSLADAPTKLVFLLAVPEKIEGTEYMEMLASISRMLVHEEFRDSLKNAKDLQEFISIVSNGNKYLKK